VLAPFAKKSTQIEASQSQPGMASRGHKGLLRAPRPHPDDSRDSTCCSRRNINRPGVIIISAIARMTENCTSSTMIRRSEKIARLGTAAKHPHGAVFFNATANPDPVWLAGRRLRDGVDGNASPSPSSLRRWHPARSKIRYFGRSETRQNTATELLTGQRRARGGRNLDRRRGSDGEDLAGREVLNPDLNNQPADFVATGG